MGVEEEEREELLGGMKDDVRKIKNSSGLAGWMRKKGKKVCEVKSEERKGRNQGDGGRAKATKQGRGAMTLRSEKY